MLFRYNPQLDEQGRIDRWYVAAFDIESRKCAEAQLEQAYLLLAEAQQLSKTGSFVTDLLADEHDWSEEAFSIFGFDPATKVTMQVIRDVVEPEDLPGFETGIERSMEGAEFDLVFRIRPVGGSIKHGHAVARVLRLMEGRPLFIGALQDVTESKIAEAELRRAHGHLAEAQQLSRTGSFTVDMVRDEHTWSDELYRIFELDPGTRITHLLIRGMVHPEDLPVRDALFERAMAGIRPDYVFRIVTSRGAVKYLRTVAHRVEQIMDRPVFIGAIQDVTAAKVAEEALNKARA